jgi:hypothetical protein
MGTAELDIAPVEDSTIRIRMNGDWKFGRCLPSTDRIKERLQASPAVKNVSRGRQDHADGHNRDGSPVWSSNFTEFTEGHCCYRHKIYEVGKEHRIMKKVDTIGGVPC